MASDPVCSMDVVDQTTAQVRVQRADVILLLTWLRAVFRQRAEEARRPDAVTRQHTSAIRRS